MNDASGGRQPSPAIQTLYRVYRPTTFDADEFVGQEHIIGTLRSAIRQNRIAHAYLFCGPRGTGKTSTARLLAKAANCLHPDPDRRPCNQCASCRAIVEGRTMDIVEIDAASNRGIDEIRALRDTVQLNPIDLRYRFYIIDECHQLTPAAWNAFLKTLEEPPPHAKFILCTTEPEKLLDTVASRCQRFDFHRYPLAQIVELLQRICEREGWAATDDALATIGRQATGSMRDALSLLDTLASYGTDGDGITLATVQRILGAGSNERVLAIIDALAANDVGAGIAAVNAAAEAGVEPGVLAGQIVAALRVMLYAAYGVPADGTDDALRERLPHFAPAEVAHLTKLFSTTEFRLKHTAYGHLPLELAVVDAVLLRTGQATPAAVTVTAPILAMQPATPPASVLPSPAMPAMPAPTVLARPERPERAAPPPDTMPQEPPTPMLRPERPRRDDAPPATPPPSPVRLVPSPEPVAPVAPAASFTLEDVDGLWRRVIPGVKMEGGSMQLYGVLADVSPADVQGNMVILHTVSDWHCSQVNKEESRAMLEKVLGGLLKQPVRVRCEVRGSQAAPAPTGRAARPMRAVPPAPLLEPDPPPSPPPTMMRPVAPPQAVASPPASTPAASPENRDTPPPTPNDHDEAGVRRMANLFDAEELRGDDAPPFPRGT